MPAPVLNPVPGTTRRNNGGYDADSGLDILVPPGTPIVACADGVLVYAEPGHTPWVEDTDSRTPGFQGPKSILLQLDKPFQRSGITVRFAWYTHLQAVSISVPDGSQPVRVKAGQVLGRTGIGNRVPHLHFGLIEDRSQTAFLPHREVAQIIWDEQQGSSLTEDPAPPPGAPPRKEHKTPERLKVFAGQRQDGFRVRVFHGEKEVPSTAIRIDAHSGKIGVSINDKQVDLDAVEVDIAFRRKE